MAQDHGPWLSTAMALLLVWSVMIFTVRIWAKLRTKNWGLDDLALSSALFLAVLQSALLWRALNAGYGHPRSEISTVNANAVQKLIYASHILYIIAMALCRVSAAFFVSHIAHSGPQSKPAHILAAMSLAWGIASIFAITLRGDMSQPWALMDGTSEVYKRWLGIESSGLFVDFTLWLLSIHLVWGLQMKLRKRIFVLTAFAVRLVLIPVVTFRLIFLRPFFNTDPYITTIVANIFTVGAIQFSIMACCVTSLKPFLHAFNQPSYSYNYKSGGTANSARSATRDSYHRLETWRKIERTDGSANSNDPASWRPYQPTGEGHVTALPKQTHSRSRDRVLSSVERKKSKRAARDDESADTDSSHRMIIQRVTEVSVSYEDTSKSPLQ